MWQVELDSISVFLSQRPVPVIEYDDAGLTGRPNEISDIWHIDLLERGSEPPWC